jgi:hypothetical protein
MSNPEEKKPKSPPKQPPATQEGLRANEEEVGLSNQVHNITLAALRDMRFDSPPTSAHSAPKSSPLHTPVIKITGLMSRDSLLGSEPGQNLTFELGSSAKKGKKLRRII